MISESVAITSSDPVQAMFVAPLKYMAEKKINSLIVNMPDVRKSTAIVTAGDLTTEITPEGSACVQDLVSWAIQQLTRVATPGKDFIGVQVTVARVPNDENATVSVLAITNHTIHSVPVPVMDTPDQKADDEPEVDVVPTEEVTDTADVEPAS